MVKLKQITAAIFFAFFFILSGDISAQITAEVEEASGKAYDYELQGKLDSAAILYEKAFYLSNEQEVALIARAGFNYSAAGQQEKAFATLHRAIDAGWSNHYTLKDKKLVSLRTNQTEWQKLEDHIRKRNTVSERTFFWGWYFGLISLLFVLNLFLFLRLRESAFLYYSLFLFFVGQWVFNNNFSVSYHFSKIMFWTQWPGVRQIYPNNAVGMLFCLFFTLFVSKLLDIKTNFPRLWKVFRTVTLILITFTILTFVIRGDTAESIVQMGVLLLIGVIIISFIAGILLLKKGFRPARFFVFAVFFLVLICIAGLLSTVGINIPVIDLGGVFNGIDLALIVFYILLSFALGDRMKILEEEKAQAQAKALDVLEEKVQERTKEVVLQKHIVEEKQKEILDSIRYARRIQLSLLPTEKYIDRVFSKQDK